MALSTSRELLESASMQEGVTTLMLVDLPLALTLADLRNEMEHLGFGRSYDFLFYPKERGQGFRGYCFVNFVSTAEAKRFARVFVDHKFKLCPSPKLSNVGVSRPQGICEIMSKIKPGKTRYHNFIIDRARLQGARLQIKRGDNPGGVSGGWQCRYVAAAGNDLDRPRNARLYGGIDLSSLNDSGSYGSIEVTSSYFPFDVVYH
eukprot:TRINITY_DN18086_c0_g1_i2.p1 TRINITY_DN18086_c0_g1~~TRINITY_DN18086_c0_g1_i2.p1  ORF type:complete len:221 (+),score=11.39 TRINITY_DN18086_c0_g1_i2:53-664(+)